MITLSELYQDNQAYKTMTDKNKEILKDIIAFIDWSIKNDRSFFWVLGNLGHDVRGLVMEEECFTPRTSGYSLIK